MSSVAQAQNDVTSTHTNFNPSWMVPPRPAHFKDRNDSLTSDENKTCEPIFAKHSYGREDLLALHTTGLNRKPPPGIEKCIFYVGNAQKPILMLPQTEGELRLQNNINSSKALSSFNRSDRNSINENNDGSFSGYRAGSGTTRRIGDNQQHSNNRWSALGSSTGGTRTWKNSERIKERISQAPSNNNADNNENEHFLQKQSQDANHEQLCAEFQTSLPTTVNQTAVREELPENAGVGRVENTSKNEICPNQNENLSSQAAHESKATNLNNKWNYLDPNGVQRGPFDSQQMQAWYSSGYFNNSLRLCRVGENSFTTLGELISTNGAQNPFINISMSPISSVVSSNQNTMPTKQVLTTTSADLLVQNHISPKLVDVEKIWSNSDDTVTSALKVKERQLIEEHKKLQEKEEILRRDEREREERERKMKALEQELSKQKEEISRLAQEKEKELELRCLQVAEYERKRREELEFLEQRIKSEQLQQQMKKEEEDRRRAKELEELIKKEQERQRQVLETEARRIREEEEARLRLIAFQEAQRIATMAEAKKAEEDKRRRDEIMRREEEKRREDEKRKEEERYREEEKRRLEAIQRNPQSHSFMKQKNVEASTKKSGWNISNESAPFTSTDWLMPQAEPQTTVNPLNQVQDRHPLKQQPRTWNPVSTVSPAPIIVGTQKAPVKTQNKQNIPKKQPQKSQESQKISEFTQWIIRRIGELNSSVDAEVFAGFIEGVDSPNEAEDYIIGYLGDSKPVRDFYHEFLTKRTELRPRVKTTPKDDLSRPAVALTDCGEKNTCQNHNSVNGPKKKKKPQKVIDHRSLGFRASGDPNRINAGEIDTQVPTPSNKKR